jgi:HD-GYP domain-containing protein (c-di-GMP phosphodiesterase class II)
MIDWRVVRHRKAAGAIRFKWNNDEFLINQIYKTFLDKRFDIPADFTYTPHKISSRAGTSVSRYRDIAEQIEKTVDLNSENPHSDNLNQTICLDALVPGDTSLPPLFSILTAALGEKDYNTHLHAQRVAGYARRLAQRLGLGPNDVHEIATGGMLHDMGKLALSDHVLHHSETELTTEMWSEVYSHPLIGAAMIESSYGKGTIYDAVLYHHERLDGSGYPFGLQTDQIPISAQIISVADCFDAITTDRPYQKRKSHAQAFHILNQMSGSFLNNDLVALLIEDVQRLGVISNFSRHGGMNALPVVT